MKKILISFFALILIVATTESCNKGGAKDVATKWLTSFYHIDYDAAKDLSTEDTKNLIASLQQFTSMIPDSVKNDRKKVNVNVKDVKEKGDTAVATYTTSDSPDKDQNITLVKVKGKWLVEFSKNDQMSGAGDVAPDQSGGGDSTGAMTDSTMH